MQSHMSGEHVGAGKAAATNVAQVGLGATVCRPRLVPRGHVLGQPIVQGEHLAANGADVGHLVGRGGEIGRAHL